MSKRKEYPTQERLRELFDYDPEGFLVWKEREDASAQINARMAGKIAGFKGVYINEKGSSVVCDVGIDYKKYRVRDIVWIYHKGQIPEGKKVAVNKGLISEKIEDLFLCPESSNFKAHYLPVSECGYRGVSRSKDGERYTCTVFENGRRTHKGTFTTAEAAAACYDYFTLKHDGYNSLLNGVSCDFEKFRSKGVNKGRIGKSGLKGVLCYGRKWSASITFGAKRIYLGSFDTKEQAARAYNIAAREKYGEHAVLNDIPDPLGEGAPI